MNDASELIYAAQLIADVIGEVLEAVSDEQLLSAFPRLPTLVNVLEYGPQPFCACFCEDGDLLSQWRGYTAGQIGYSLGIDLMVPEFALHLPRNTFLRKVMYSETQQRSWVRNIAETWLHTAQELLNSDSPLSKFDVFPHAAVSALQEVLIEPHLCFKNPAFSEEQEWRFIKLIHIQDELDLVRDQQAQAQAAQWGVELPDFPARSNAEGIDIKFRQSSLGFVPYIELSLKHRSGPFMNRLALEKVIQGPAANPRLSCQSLAMYIQSHGYGFPSTEIRPSRIPLR